MALASSILFLLHVVNINIDEMKWKSHIIIMIKTDRFVVTMHSGLCEQYVQSLGVAASGLDFPFRTRQRALWQQHPPEPISTR